MLVLTREEGQRIRIGENVTLTLVRVNGRKVRIGFEAPDGVKILRTELEDPQAPQPLPEAA